MPGTESDGVFNQNGDEPEYSAEHIAEMLSEKLISLENKSNQQEVEINLLKSALSDVLTRLSVTEKRLSSPRKSGDNQQNGHAPLSPRLSKGKKSDMNNSEPVAREKTPPVVRDKPLTRRSSYQEIKPPSTISPAPIKKKVFTRANSADVKIGAARKIAPYIPGEVNENKTPVVEGMPKLILAKKPTIVKKKNNSARPPSGSEERNGNSPKGDECVKFYIRGRTLHLYGPSDYKESKEDGTPPEEELQLNWVYGYRGKDSRDNLFRLPNGELVYNMAGVVVIQDEIQNKQRHFTKHTDDVKSIALHPNQEIVASGQVAGHGDDAKPHVLVWDVGSFEILSTFGHGVFDRGICALEFSTLENGQYLIVIDESNDHCISLWDWQKQVKLTEQKCSKEILFGAKWNPKMEQSFVTYGKSHLNFWTFSPEEKSLVKRSAVYEKLEKPKYVLAIVFSENGDVYSGDSNGNIVLFKNGNNRVSLNVNSGSKGGVFGLYIHSDGKMISCGKDGQICLWDSELTKLKDIEKLDEQLGSGRCILFQEEENSYIIGTTKNCIVKCQKDGSELNVLVQGHVEELWGLAAHKTEALFATCSQDQKVCVWDSQNWQNLWCYELDDEGLCAEFHTEENIILVGTKCGTIFVLDYESKQELVALPVSREPINDIKVSPDGGQFVVACRDTNIYLYNWPKDISNFKKPKTLQGHSSRVLHLDWSIDSAFIQSNSADYELLYWHAESGLQVVSPIALRDINWDTWTCPFGFPVMGIWQEGADGTDVNACSRSSNQQYVATGDDFGALSLFRYPSVKLKSESKVGTGHSSHVTNVRFLREDKYLISTGGNDCSVMQWEIVKVA